MDLATQRTGFEMPPPWARTPLRLAGIARRARVVAAAMAALVSIELGATTVSRSISPNPYWPRLQELSALREAPIAAGTLLVLVPPAAAARDEAWFWLYEANWTRPDLLWSLAETWPLPDAPEVGVCVGEADLPLGWNVVWRRGRVAVARYSETR